MTTGHGVGWGFYNLGGLGSSYTEGGTEESASDTLSGGGARVRLASRPGGEGLGKWWGGKRVSGVENRVGAGVVAGRKKEKEEWADPIRSVRKKEKQIDFEIKEKMEIQVGSNK